MARIKSRVRQGPDYDCEMLRITATVANRGPLRRRLERSREASERPTVAFESTPALRSPALDADLTVLARGWSELSDQRRLAYCRHA